MSETKVVKAVVVREYLAANPGAKPKDVSEALKAKGVDVTPGHVSVIKNMEKNKGKEKTKPTKKASPKKVAKTKPTGVIADTLIAAAAFCKTAGGFEKAAEALELLKKVASSDAAA